MQFAPTLIVLLFIFFVSGLFTDALAQPRQNVGTVAGAGEIRSLQIGDTIPEELWNLPLKVVNHPDGKQTVTLNDYRDRKLIILDFWATWCSPCIASVIRIDSLLQENCYRNIALLPVCVMDTEERLRSFIERRQWTKLSAYGDKTLHAHTLAHYKEGTGVVWIYDGILYAVPKKASINKTNLDALERGHPDGLEIVNFGERERRKRL